MTAFAYLALLSFSLAGMAVCDHRWRLAFFRDPRRAAAVALAVVPIFLLWDALGIVTGTFYRGDSPYMTGIELAPEMPLEEPIFLFFLTYLTMNVTSAVRTGLSG
ncbi:lycopene cyclase domain-containing protein [Corynebacterium sp.]|uniref:lycopene cyclase domain-containing protein n=1 Tax=Corynebacterium sp. TaxID=1720 RepID=UPI002A91B086|nr:lycopene cyclase domain-containing protein [Corynebacterium sp.]MDY5786441.1 lycopene cyclase domain-containing protein [Corynebacterium sp.]